jgi:hypothetical protein
MTNTATTPEIEVGKPYVVKQDGHPLFGGFAVAVVKHEEFSRSWSCLPGATSSRGSTPPRWS